MTTLLEMRGISKAFAGVKALNDVNFTVRQGEIHAVVGENGAGKSTLMKVLSGVYPHGSYSGEIYYEGKEQRFSGIADSEKLGNEQARFGIIDWHAAFARTQELLAKVGLRESPDTLVTHLGVGKQQLVEV